MPIELSPKKGVPTGERLDTFHRTTENLGVPITTDLKESIALPNDVVLIRENALPLDEKAYKQLLNTVAGILEDGSGLLGRLKKIKFLKGIVINTSIAGNGLIRFDYIPARTERIADENPPKIPVLLTEYESRLDSINPYKSDWKNLSLRNATLTTEHEAVHYLLMGALREFVETSKLTVHPAWSIVDSIIKFYLQQLQTKDPKIMEQAAKDTMLTDYFTKAIIYQQEFFTTLFEANASEIASRTPITQEMSEAVGSTVDHLTQQKEAYLPTVSPEQRDQLAQIIQLIKDTPFNLKDWWQSQNKLRNEFRRNLKVPEVDEAEAKFLAENAHLLDLPKRFMTMLDNLDEKELMITMLHRLV